MWCCDLSANQALEIVSALQSSPDMESTDEKTLANLEHLTNETVDLVSANGIYFELMQFMSTITLLELLRLLTIINYSH